MMALRKLRRAAKNGLWICPLLIFFSMLVYNSNTGDNPVSDEALSVGNKDVRQSPDLSSGKR